MGRGQGVLRYAKKSEIWLRLTKILLKSVMIDIKFHIYSGKFHPFLYLEEFNIILLFQVKLHRHNFNCFKITMNCKISWIIYILWTQNTFQINYLCYNDRGPRGGLPHICFTDVMSVIITIFINFVVITDLYWI